MATLRVYGLYDFARQKLAIDLRHFLRVLAPRSVQASWTVSTVKSADAAHEWFEATGDGGQDLDALAQDNGRISGAVLAALAEATHQVIWGEFTGRFPSETDGTWITIRAVDSTFYEIKTLDDTAVGKIKAAFRDVRMIGDPVD